MGRSNDFNITTLATKTLTINQQNVSEAGYFCVQSCPSPDSPGDYIYTEGTIASITAFTNPGYIFYGFYAQFAGLRFLYEDNPHQFLMNTDYVVTPLFRIPTTLIISAPGTTFPIGTSIRFTIRLTETPTGVGIPGKIIDAAVQSSDGTITYYVTTAIDAGGGNYYFDWTPTEVNTYKVFSDWLGDSTVYPDILTGIYAGC